MDSRTIPTGSEFLPDVSKRSLLAMRRKEPDGRYRLHLDAAIMRKDGHTVGEIAKELDMHTNTVGNWLRRMSKAGGFGDGYRFRPGRPSRLTAGQLGELEKDMKKPPARYGLESETWTSRTVSQHVQGKFGIYVPHPSMRRILTRGNVKWPGSAAATGRRG